MYEVNNSDPMMNCETVLMIELWIDNSVQPQLEGYRKNREAILINVYIYSTVPRQPRHTILYQTNPV